MTMVLSNENEPSAAWWLLGSHGQTTWAGFMRARPLVTFTREVVNTPDGDEVMLDHVDGGPGAPRLVLLHGLEGSAHSLHTQALTLLAQQRGWSATTLNFRSCARDPAAISRRLSNRRPRLYHAGDTADFDLVVRRLRAREPDAPLMALGLSFGGNVLLKWLGEIADDAEAGAAARPLLDAAVTISVPYDLDVAGRYLERPVGRFYVRHFMPGLKSKTFDLLKRFPDHTKQLDVRAIRKARTFRDFDECVTAPLHGFGGATDYYQRASAQPYLARIKVPTLAINATDDPFYPAAALETARAVASPQVSFRTTRWGGHAGFVTGRWPWRPSYWAEELALRWLAARTGIPVWSCDDRLGNKVTVKSAT